MTINLEEGAEFTFAPGNKKYRVGINVDGSPRLIEANPLPTTPGVYTIKLPGYNNGWIRLVLDGNGKWHRLDLFSGTFDDRGGVRAPLEWAEQAAERGTLNLAHPFDDRPESA